MSGFSSCRNVLHLCMPDATRNQIRIFARIKCVQTLKSLSSRMRFCVCSKSLHKSQGKNEEAALDLSARKSVMQSQIDGGSNKYSRQNTEKIFIEVNLMATKIVGSVELSKCHEIVEIFCQYSSTSSSDFLRLLSLDKITQNFLKRSELIKADLGFCVLLLCASHGLSFTRKMQQFSSSTTSIVDIKDVFTAITLIALNHQVHRQRLSS